MSSVIKLKNGSGAPATSDLVQGEPAFDLTNKRLYTENASGAIIEIGTKPSTIDIDAGTIDGTIIGGNAVAAGSFAAIVGTTGTFSGVVDASAEGIKLGGTAAANLVDDADKGGHVSAITPSGSGTLTLAAAQDTLAYTKIGRNVSITGTLQVTATSSPVGDYVNISLPFTIASLDDASERVGSGVTYYDASAAVYSVLPMLGISGTAIRVYVNAASLAVNDQFTFSFSYPTT